MDKCIHEQHLGISDWHQSYGEIMRKTDLPSFNNASKSLVVTDKKGSFYQSSTRQTQNKFMFLISVRVNSASSSSSTQHSQQQNHSDMLRSIMEKITTHTQWLQDDDLDHGLLDSFQPAEATLVKITHVFAALGIKNMQDVVELHNHFLPYMFCPNCHVTSGSTTNNSTEDKDGSATERCTDHHYVIESAMVVPTLRAYIEQIFDSSNDGNATPTRLGRHNDLVSRMLNAEDVTQFWNCFAEFVPAQRKIMWTALESGLNRFLHVMHRYGSNEFRLKFVFFQILKKREKLDVECEFLRKQNEELKHLLLRYLPQYDADGVFEVEDTESYNN